MSVHVCTTSRWSTFTFQPHGTAHVYVHHIMMVYFHISASWHCMCVCTPHHDGPLSHFILMSLHVSLHVCTTSQLMVHFHTSASCHCIGVCTPHHDGPLSHFILMSLHVCTTSQLMVHFHTSASCYCTCVPHHN